jgi:hypothetical protein
MSRRAQATAQVDPLAGATMRVGFRLRRQSFGEFIVLILSSLNVDRSESPATGQCNVLCRYTMQELHQTGIQS